MAKASEGKIARKEEEGIQTADSMPEFMKGEQGRGTEMVDPRDLELPRLKLLQDLSDEPKTFDGAKPGMLWHTVLERAVQLPVHITPVFVDTRYILWRPRHMGGGILARSDDGRRWSPKKGSEDEVVWRLASTVDASGLANWGSYDPRNPNSPPAATKIIAVVAVILEPEYREMSPVVIAHQRSQIKVARRLVTKIRMSRAPAYGQVHRVESVQDQNNEGQKFFNFRYTASGILQSKEDFDAMKEFYEKFLKSGIQIRDVEGMQGDVPDVAGAEEPEASDPKAKY